MTIDEFNKALNGIEQNITNTFSGLGVTIMETQANFVREETRRKAKELQDLLAGWCDKCHANLTAQARATGNDCAEFCGGRSWSCPVFAAAAHTQQILDDCEKWEKVSHSNTNTTREAEEVFKQEETAEQSEETKGE